MYWLAWKNDKYISDIDKHGKIIHTKDKEKAYKFYNFNVAMIYFKSGYCILKEV